MSITTLEELQAVPEGQVIIDRRNGVTRGWRREGEWLVSESFRIRPEDMVPDLTAGQVTLGEAPVTQESSTLQVGDVIPSVEAFLALPDGTLFEYRRNSNQEPSYMKQGGDIHLTLDGQRICQFTSGHSNAMEVRALPTQTPEVETPDPEVERLRARVEQLLEQLQRHSNDLGNFKAEVQEALHTYLEEHGGLTDTEREGVLEVLDNLGLDRPSTEVDMTCTIDVSGRSSIYLDDAMAEAVGGDVTVDMDRVDIEWTKTLTYSATVNEGESPHESLDDSDVHTMLHEEGVADFDSFDWECSDCSTD